MKNLYNYLELVAWILLDALYCKFSLKTFNKLYKYKKPFSERLAKKYGYIMKGIEKYKLLKFHDAIHGIRFLEHI